MATPVIDNGIISASTVKKNGTLVTGQSNILGITQLSAEQTNNITATISTNIEALPNARKTPSSIKTVIDNAVTNELNIKDPAILADIDKQNYEYSLTGVSAPTIDPNSAYTTAGSAPYNPNIDTSPTNSVNIARNSGIADLQKMPVIRPGFIGSDKNKTGTLQHIISGADLSVFFMMELPSIADMADATLKDKPYLWKKELILIELDSVMSLGYSIVREVFPVRSIGNSKPRAFTRGGITIAGHIAFAIFTDDVLVRMRVQMQESVQRLYAKSAEAKKNAGSSDLAKITEIQKQYQMFNNMLNVGDVYMLNQLLPFHILVMGTNEQGNFSKMMIKGVRIIDENQLQGVSQPNIMNKVTFAAEDIFPMAVGSTDSNGEFTATSNKDIANISTSKFNTYTGSQIMTDVATMQSGSYRLKG